MRIAIAILALFALAGAPTAAYLTVLEPVEARLADGDSVRSGVAGPGQHIEIVADRHVDGANWDRLVVAENTLPAGWSRQDSLVYESGMKAIIYIPADARDGEYSFYVKATDEGNYEGLGELTFTYTVSVSRELLGVQIEPAQLVTGVAQPAVYAIRIDNNSTASDTFEISSSGLPSEWRYKRRVFVPHNAIAEAPYEIVSTEEGEYAPTITVRSLSSPFISQSKGVALVTRPSLLTDYQAAGRGLLVFPLVEQPIYSLIAFLANVLG